MTFSNSFFCLQLATLAFAATVAGCSSPPPSKLPVKLSTPSAVAADECMTIVAGIDSGASGVPFASHQPAKGRVLEARCEDEAVCGAELRNADVLVRGKAAGETMVVVKYEHPDTHERGEGKVKVTFKAIGPSDALHPRAVGGSGTCPKSGT